MKRYEDDTSLCFARLGQRVLTILCMCLFLAINVFSRDTTSFTAPPLADSALLTAKFDSVRQILSTNDVGVQSTGKTAASPSKAIKSESMLFVLARVMGSLALIIALILGIAFIVKKGGFVGSSKPGGNGSMDLVETLSLGTHRSIALVRVLDSVYVLAQTSTNITLLEQISGDRALELIASTKGGVSIARFKDVFDTFMGRMRKPS